MEVDLTPFLGEKGWRLVDSAWVRGGWKYATDGRIGVRVPTDEPDTDECSDVKRAPAADWFRDFDRSGTPTPFPEHDAKTVTGPCYNVAHNCPKCGEWDCYCVEARQHKDCPDCGGAMECQIPAPQTIDDRRIGGRLFAKIKALPGAKYLGDGGPKGKTGIECALRFISDGGLQGVVAMLRRKTDG